MLKRIAINGLRGFGEERAINFSIPNDKEGSGLNIIVGPNNAGKTTIVEAIKFYNSNKDNISFSEGKRNVKNGCRVEITYEDGKGSVTKVCTVEAGGSEVDIIGNVDNNKIPYVLPSRRYAEHNMYNRHYYSDDRSIYSSNQIMNSKNRTSTLSQFEQRVFKWHDNKTKFDEVLKKIIIEPFDWTIEQNEDGSYYIKIIFSDNSISHTREGVGDGFWSIFTIVDSLYDSEIGDIIVIDEPELSLHPAFQKRVINILAEYSKDRQIIITTHSPYFISLEAIVNGGMLIRSYKGSSGNIETGAITDNDRGFINSLIRDFNNPHVLGLEARELFFTEDDIIITEGQEDVIIIPRVCAELGIQLTPSLFGWGAGGAEKISKVLSMLKNLGYKKVSAIFDGDKRGEYNKCTVDFPEYNTEILPEDDIRDKEPLRKEAKKGMCTVNGRIKTGNVAAFKEIVDSINTYHLSAP